MIFSKYIKVAIQQFYMLIPSLMLSIQDKKLFTALFTGTWDEPGTAGVSSVYIAFVTAAMSARDAPHRMVLLKKIQ